jgi:hypothetical protein
MIMSRSLSAGVALLTAASLSFGASNHAMAGAPKPATDVKVALDIEVAASMPSREMVVNWTTGAAESALRKGDVVIDAKNPTHVVEVEVSGTAAAYSMRLTARDGDRIVAQSKEPILCECTDDEFVEAVEREVTALVPSLRAEAPSEATAPTEVVPPSSTGPELKAERGNPRAMKNAGAGLIGVGGGGMLAGIILVALPDKRVLEDDPTSSRVQEFRPVGGIVLGAGALVAVTGLALFLAGRKRAKQDASTAVLPVFGPHSAGLSLTRRF